jgi:hypothetical protein
VADVVPLLLSPPLPWVGQTLQQQHELQQAALAVWAVRPSRLASPLAATPQPAMRMIPLTAIPGL